MKNFQTFHLISHTDGNVFMAQVKEAVNVIENKGWNAEVQFSTAVQPNGLALYSALVMSGKL